MEFSIVSFGMGKIVTRDALISDFKNGGLQEC